MQTVTRARHLRSEMTLPEVLLWQALRARPAGLKFRRQHPAGDFILDFYCAAANLAVEVDGEIHASPDQIEHDRRRDLWLARRDVRVLRLPASLILSDIVAAIDAIVAHATPGQPLHQPSAGPPQQVDHAPHDRGSSGGRSDLLRHAGEDLRTS